jgi:hypothetical protein
MGWKWLWRGFRDALQSDGSGTSGYMTALDQLNNCLLFREDCPLEIFIG